MVPWGLVASAFCLCPSPSKGSRDGTPVVLNVYDITSLNNFMCWLGLGMFHSGIEVHGSEYGFGAHDRPTSGVFEVEPKNCPGFVYKCSILLGRTKMQPAEFQEFMENMASEYHGDTYHLILKNCNHFTDDVCLRLTGKPIPGWVNRLAHLGNVCSCVLPESLPLSPVKQVADHCMMSEDSSAAMSIISALELDYTDQGKHLLSPSSSDGELIPIIVHRL